MVSPLDNSRVWKRCNPTAAVQTMPPSLEGGRGGGGREAPGTCGGRGERIGRAVTYQASVGDGEQQRQHGAVHKVQVNPEYDG